MSAFGFFKSHKDSKPENTVALTGVEYDFLHEKLKFSGFGFEGIRKRLASPGPGVMLSSLIGGMLFAATTVLAVGEANFGGGINPGGTATILGIEAAIVAVPWAIRGAMHFPRKRAVEKIEKALKENRRPVTQFYGLPRVELTLARA